jgi:hypothetical protein
MFLGGIPAALVRTLLCIVGLFCIGAEVSLTAGASLLVSAGRQILLGVAAAILTFGLVQVQQSTWAKVQKETSYLAGPNGRIVLCSPRAVSETVRVL